MTEEQVRAWYGIATDARLPRSALELHELALLLYAAWRSFEARQPIEPTAESFAPPQFFHVATELCDMVYSNPNFQRPEHILWPTREKNR